MKKYLTVLLASIVFVSALAACGNNQEAPNKNQVNSLSENEGASEPEASKDNTQSTVPVFLPPAEHSNFIAPKGHKGQNYNITKLDFINGKEVSAMDVNHFSLGREEVYDLNGNFLFNDQTIKNDYSKELSYVSIGEMVKSGEKNYVMVSLKEFDSDNYKNVLYNYPEHSFFDLDDDVAVNEAYEDYIVLNNYQSPIASTYFESVIDWNKKTIISFDEGYTRIRFLYNDRFIAQKGESNAYLLDASGNVICNMPADVNYTTFKQIMKNQSSLTGNNYCFYDRNNLANDYFIGIKENYSGDKWLSVSVYIYNRDGEEVLSYDAPDINYPIRMVSQYNGKTYISENIDDYYNFEESGQKHQKVQLIDDHKNMIVAPCADLSGFFNGYCLFDEVNVENATITSHLIDLENNEIDSVERPLYYDYTNPKTLNYLSIVDEQGLYILEEYSNNTSIYTIKDTAGNVVFTSDSEIKNIKMLGNGVFQINRESNSESDYLIRISPA